ncbi:MAG TPA: coagulation factor 5/8 type domain-containing protein, partial [Tepidisphaeraceae bacterium]|nr:coagulation factor 5/8 type domain-containing protein [Tepidisphaeraceae bacterium]
RPNTVVLGLGYPTLIPEGDEPAMRVGDVAGVKIAGLIFDAGRRRTPTLLQVGDARGGPHAGAPICLYDICARAGGASAGTCDCFVIINSNQTIGDNLWLWRADHGAGAGWDTNKVKNGLIVNGNDVTLYGLFVEHCQEYQTLWNGNGGKVYFYQSELPYDPPSQSAWSSPMRAGYASYKVADGVTSHQAWGLGIYSYFTGASVTCDSAIECPPVPGVQFHDMTTIRLGGQPGSGIAHVINGRGEGHANIEPVRLDD